VLREFFVRTLATVISRTGKSASLFWGAADVAIPPSACIRLLITGPAKENFAHGRFRHAPPRSPAATLSSDRRKLAIRSRTGFAPR
jgi:hypothetical protein